MHKKHSAWILTLLLSLLSAAVVPKASAQATSTLEERARWVEITHKLERTPLDGSANKDGEWALNPTQRRARHSRAVVPGAPSGI